jgi:hypothetical protein
MATATRGGQLSSVSSPPPLASGTELAAASRPGQDDERRAEATDELGPMGQAPVSTATRLLLSPRRL